MPLCASKASPTRTWENDSLRASTRSSWRSRLTTIRVSDEHTCPVMRQARPVIVAAAVAMS